MIEKLKKIKVKYNLILGVLLGFLLAQIVMAEGYAILIKKYQYSNEVGTGIPYENIVFFRILSGIVFVLTILIFNTKRFKRINLNKISIYLILVIIVAIVVAVEAVLGMILITFNIYPDIKHMIGVDYFLSINLVYLVIFFGVSIFLFVFVALVNRKVKYIKSITKEVKVIKNEGFGKTIEVKGNDELADLSKSINDMSIELRQKIDNEKAIEKSKNELISSVSHDLRTPLTSIIGYVDLLKKNGFQDKEKFDTYLDVIDERTKTLNKLINELFEYTKLNSHDIKLNYSEVEIVSLIEQMVGEYTPIFTKEGLEIEKDIIYKDIFINVDVEKMVRVLENLLTNARKYSVKNSKVLVKVFEERGEEITLEQEKKSGLRSNLEDSKEHVKISSIENRKNNNKDTEKTALKNNKEYIKENSKISYKECSKKYNKETSEKGNKEESSIRDYLVISISNKVEEIKAHDLENLFERFYKVDKSRKDLESTGLGLSIVKRIVELHNGTVKVELNEDIITFKVYLPIE